VAFLQNANLSEVGDVELMFTGDRFPVIVGPDLISTGWRGGQFVQYVAASRDFTVEASDGNAACGFLLFPSEYYGALQPGSFSTGADPLVGSNQNWLSSQPANGVGGQNVVTLVEGGTRAFFKVYETTALDAFGARAGGPITYTLNEQLKISERGILCNDSDPNLAAAGVTTPQVVGIVSALPSARNGNRLGIDLKY
jgi:hypothetical protein